MIAIAMQLHASCCFIIKGLSSTVQRELFTYPLPYPKAYYKMSIGYSYLFHVQVATVAKTNSFKNWIYPLP